MGDEKPKKLHRRKHKNSRLGSLFWGFRLGPPFTGGFKLYAPLVIALDRLEEILLTQPKDAHSVNKEE